MAINNRNARLKIIKTSFNSAQKRSIIHAVNYIDLKPLFIIIPCK